MSGKRIVRYRGSLSAALLTTLGFTCLVGWSLRTQAGPPKPAPAAPESKAAPVVGSASGLSAADTAAMQVRFQQDVWPLLTRAQGSCVTCHSKDNPSQLHFPVGAAPSFQMLLAGGRLDPANPSSLIARITATDPAQRMPPSSMPGWSDADKKTLQDFMASLAARRQTASVSGPKPDEVFPAELLTPYHGHSVSEGADNTFLTYYQLRRKVIALFGDDWNRNGKDLFEENLAQFSGADFVHRFDESDHPTAAYLSAVSAMASDVSARAYLAKSGPFAGRPAVLPMPGTAPETAIHAQIASLYQRLLFRAPTTRETQDAEALLKGVAQSKTALETQTDPLIFQLEARDDSGQRTVQQVEIGTVSATDGLSTFFVNQNVPKTDNLTLPQPIALRPGDSGQRMEISNRDTSGHVSFKSLTLTGPLPSKATTVITSGDPTVQAEGSWQSYGDHAKDAYDDDDNNKGSSRLIIPIKVAKAGKYQISLTWVGRDDGSNAPSVPVEVYSRGARNLTLPPALPVPPKGEADFTVDESADEIPYDTLPATFQFGKSPQSGVALTNKNTHRRVVADAVAYIPASQPDGKPLATVQVDSITGHDTWPVFKPDNEIFTTVIGPNLRSDDNAHKGDLHLLFPAASSLASNGYYGVRFLYPGHVGNETQAPLTIYAAKSSPIIRLRAPFQAPKGAALTLDAASSYNVQHTPLHYHWTQIGGPQATLANADTAVLHCTIAPLNVQQAAWQGLCRALILHPDFLFTRPRSLMTTRDATTRRHLQLVKVAQDLVARPPTSTEIARLDKGASLTSLVNTYLASADFNDFYTRRVRLYLESHGTPSQDEPVRLWRYVMQSNLPYMQILTADYTITPDGKKEQRPAYCGHSGVLSMPGFIEGKPGLPHFNYAAQVCEKFLGYIFEVTPAIIKARGTQTASSTVDPHSLCYSCHQMLTPLAYQRTRWTDDGKYITKDDSGSTIDDTDRHAVATYGFKGEGLQSFALAAQKKERFHRTMIQTHFIWYFGREMRFDTDERGLYHRLWNTVHQDKFALKPLVRAIVTSPEYLGGVTTASAAGSKPRLARSEKSKNMSLVSRTKKA